jgi:fumarylacetoacetase
MQRWEYVPLGPFLSKSFGSVISPWIVTLEALKPFFVEGPVQQPQVLPYLKQQGMHNIDINLEVNLKAGSEKETLVCRSNFKYLYWSMAQQLAHQTVAGCNVRVGDMYASGTISGPTREASGSLLELTWNGSQPIELNDGSKRTYIEDNDSIIMRAFAQKENLRIGFGECRTTIIPSKNRS